MLTLVSLRSGWLWDMEFLCTTSGSNAYTIKYSIIDYGRKKTEETKIVKIIIIYMYISNKKALRKV